MLLPKAVLFDFGGTLDAPGVPWLDRAYPHYAEEGVVIPPEAFAPAFYDSDDQLPLRPNLRGLGLQETMRLQVEGVLKSLGRESSPAQAIADRFVAEARLEFDRNRPLLEELRGRYRLGIVSNFYGNLEAILRGEGLLDFFDVVIDSGVVGVAKPDPRIFREALEALGADAPNAWMVGDSLRRDMRGAESLGMPHAWLVGNKPGAAPCCPRGAVLRSLKELGRILR